MIAQARRLASQDAALDGKFERIVAAPFGAATL